MTMDSFVQYYSDQEITVQEINSELTSSKLCENKHCLVGNNVKLDSSLGKNKRLKWEIMYNIKLQIGFYN